MEDPIRVTPDPLPAGAPPTVVIEPARGPRADVIYPGRYVWYIFVSALDVILTETVIEHFGAEEVNTIANQMLQEFGVMGLVGLKLSTVILVILICDTVGRRQYETGRRLAEWAIALSVVPVVISLIQIALVSVGWLPTPAQLSRPSDPFIW